MANDDITIGGLRGEDLSAFILMLENGSSLESIQDEFGFNVSEIKRCSETAHIKAREVGGLNKLRDMVEPIKKAAKDADFTESPLENTVPKTDVPQKNSTKDVVSEYPTSSKISKTSIGLRDALFKTMDDLIAGRIEATDAVAICGVSKAICDTVKLEMDAERLMATTKNGKDGPRMLRLGEVADQ